MKDELSTTYTWCVVPERGWIEAYQLQDQLAKRSQHGGASAVDLIVAVTAERHGLTVLHDDRDYEAISRVTGLPVQRVTD
jgi:predicted nucleic acid-binding protein